MKKVFLLWCLAISCSAIGQNSQAIYRKADSLYRVKDYKNAAILYAEGIRSQGNNVEMRRYRSTISSWAMANVADSAFQLLDIISTLPNLYKADLQQLEYGPDFISIRTDKRWEKSVKKIREQAEKNGFPQEEFIYGRKDGMALTLVMMKPKRKSNGKAIISVRSGDWVSSYNGIEVNPLGLEQHLAKGFTIFTVMHGSQPRYAIPDEVNDLKRAVRYIRYNAARFEIDPNHIGITGGSSGGHLALLIATADDKPNPVAPDPVDRVSSRVQAIAVLFPPTDLLNWDGKGLNAVNAFPLQKLSQVYGALDFKIMNDRAFLLEPVTDTIARNKIGREISPYYHVSPDDPPVFIIHGDADLVVPLYQSQAIMERFKEMGVTNQFVIKKGGTHRGDNMNPEWQQFADWFEKYLK
jgi:acetyl esterase/lipase